MTPSEIELVRSQPEWWRIAKFAPMKASGRINQEQYEYILSLPYTPINETPGEVCADSGQSGANTIGGDGCGYDRTQTGETPSQEPATTPMERDDSVLLSRDTDGNAHESGGMHPNINKGQSQKKRILILLSDYKPHTSTEIMDRCYFIEEREGGYCNYKARIDELRNEGWDIPRAEKVKGTLHSYTLKGRKISEAAKNIASG